MNDNSVYEDKYFEVISPVPALNCRDDGGHLILIKKDKAAVINKGVNWL